jgi:hypothetical protein
MEAQGTTALVVVESMFGNTERIGRAVADGLAAQGVPVQLLDVSAAPVDLPPTVGLIVIGAPTHAFSLSSPHTRAEAVRQGAPIEKAAYGLRDWLSAVLPQDPRHAPVVAVFDTRATKVRRLPAAAGPRAARLAKRRGLRVVIGPEAFLVADTRGPLVDGELARATAWGRRLAADVPRIEAHRPG